MGIFDNINKTSVPNAHGEVNFIRIEEGFVDDSDLETVSPENEAYIVGHSESGHHHLLEAEHVTVKRGRYEGMDVLYAIVDESTRVTQNRTVPHAKQVIAPGKYIITNNVEPDSITGQIRRVTD